MRNSVIPVSVRAPRYRDGRYYFRWNIFTFLRCIYEDETKFSSTDIHYTFISRADENVLQKKEHNVTKSSEPLLPG